MTLLADDPPKLCIALLVSCMLVASAVDVDYRHTAIGNGTLMTDYEVDLQDRSEAVGSLRGTGDLLDRNAFTTKSTYDLSVEEKFVFSGDMNSTGDPAALEIIEYPKWPGKAGSFRFTGADWAEGLGVAASNESNPMLSIKELEIPVISSISGYESLETSGNFEFGGTTKGDKFPATVYTQISNSSRLEVDALLNIKNESFDYQSYWSTNSKVTVRSAVGGPGEIMHEIDTWITGDQIGRKLLNITK